MTLTRLTKIVAALRKQHGRRVALPPVRDPYRLLLLEQVAYLADDATRLAAFRLLEKEIGTDAEDILAAPLKTLAQVTRAGGAIAYELRAKRLKTIAERVLSEWDGDLSKVGALPFADARRELMKYPSIGKPGAERILLLMGAYAPLALESNALRVLLRLGYGRESTSYDKTYASVQEAAAREIPERVVARRTAHLTLRVHGQDVCVRTRPRCVLCAVRSKCPVGTT